jgi:hypothetical protein
MVHCPSPWEMSSWKLFRFHSTCNYTHFVGLNFRKERLFLASQIEIRVYVTDIMTYSVEFSFFQFFLSPYQRQLIWGRKVISILYERPKEFWISSLRTELNSSLSSIPECKDKQVVGRVA